MEVTVDAEPTLLVPMGPGIIPEVSLVLKRSLCLPINLDLNEPSGFVLAAWPNPRLPWGFLLFVILLTRREESLRTGIYCRCKLWRFDDHLAV
jgi:hypothetical protein